MRLIHRWMVHGRWAALLLLMAGIIAGMVGVSAAPVGVSAQISPEQELAERYAPIAMLKTQTSTCDEDGEAYFPAPVDFLFNNPDILLRHNDGGDQKDDTVLAEGFTAQDLVNAGPETYLDFPGDPRKPGCGYETYFKQKVDEFGLEPTTYARIIIDEGARKLYIEYWFYYYFNDWNNTHESDWEMITVIFDGVYSVEEALTVSPSRVGYAQHGGGELADWDATKFQRVGDRPVVFPSAGSHATYYDQNTFIGWGEGGTAFGCDDTTAPSTEADLNVILVPEAIDPEGEFAFMLYEGHWGQRDFAVYEGPKGPNLGGKWNDPTEAFSTWRTSTLVVPSGRAGGVNTTDTFCTLSAVGSSIFTYFLSHPWATIAALLSILAVLGFFLYKVWPYFLEAIDIYGNELRTFLGIGAMALPVSLIGGLTVGYLNNVPPLEWINAGFNNSTGGKLAASLTIGSLQQIVMVALIVPACVYAMKDIRRGVVPGVWRSFVGAFKALPVTIPAIAVIVLLLLGSTISLVFLPIAIYVVVRWQFFLEAAILDDKKPFTDALGESWRVTKGEWLRAVLGSVVFQTLAIIPGPLIGVLVMIVGGSRVSFANFLSGFVYALTIPIAAVGITMLYHRLARHEIVEPKIVTRPIEEVDGVAAESDVVTGAAQA